MKKILFIAMAIAFLSTITSCKKEAKVFHAYFGGKSMEKLHMYNDTENHLYFPCWDYGRTNVVNINGIVENVQLLSDKHVTFPCPESLLDEENFYMFTLGEQPGTLVPGTTNQYTFNIPSLENHSHNYDIGNYYDPYLYRTIYSTNTLLLPLAGYANQNNGDVNFKTTWSIIKLIDGDHHIDIETAELIIPDGAAHFTITATGNDRVPISGDFTATVNNSTSNPISISPITSSDDESVYSRTLNYGLDPYYIAVPSNLKEITITPSLQIDGYVPFPRTYNLEGRLQPGKVTVVDATMFYFYWNDINKSPSNGTKK